MGHFPLLFIVAYSQYDSIIYLCGQIPVDRLAYVEKLLRSSSSSNEALRCQIFRSTITPHRLAARPSRLDSFKPVQQRMKISRKILTHHQQSHLIKLNALTLPPN